MMKRHFKAKVATAVLGVALATALTPALAMADTTGLPNEDVYTETNVSAEELSPALPSTASTSTDGTSAQTGDSDASARPSDESATGGVTPQTPGQSTSAPDAPADDPTTSAASPVSDATEPETPAPSDSMNDGANEPDGATSPNKAAQAGDVIDGVITTQDDSGTCGDGVSWTLTGDTLAITYDGTGTGEMTDFQDSAATPWNSYLSSITTVTVGEGVTKLGAYSFSMSSTGTPLAVTLPNSLITIGNYAFMGNHRLQTLIIPDNVNYIGEAAFSDCLYLDTISINAASSALQSIGNDAFVNTAITSISLPDSLTTIGNNAFNGCQQLGTVSIGVNASQLISVGSNAFNDVYSGVQAFSTVNYAGSSSQWNNITIAEGNGRLTQASIQYSVQDPVTPTTYTITFDAGNGTFSENGSNSLTLTTDTNGYLTQQPSTPTQSGYTFAGWFDAATGGNAVSTSAQFSTNTTVYAQWTQDVQTSFTINFYLNDGTGATFATPTMQSAGSVNLPGAPSRYGYTFSHWALSDGTQIDPSTYTFTNTTDVYAQWTQIQTGTVYTITFDAYTGQFADQSTTTTLMTDGSGVLQSLPTTPTKSGYNFVGWYTDANAGDLVQVGHAFTSDALLYARWTPDYSTPVEYTISFYLNDGVNTGVYSTITTTDSYGYHVLASLPAQPTRDGYDFAGWFTETSGGTKIELLITNFYGDCPVYAQWTSQQVPVAGYTITFDANGGTLTGDATMTTDANGNLGSLPSAPSWEGYTFTGWFDAAIGGNEVTTGTSFTANTTVYAQWTRNGDTPTPGASYTITFYPNGGTLAEGVVNTRTTGTDGKLAGVVSAPVMDGYTFVGWFTATNGGEQVTTSYVFTADATVYAQWTQNTTPVDPDDPNDPDNPDDPNVPDNPDQPIKPVYNVIDGANGQWTAESGAALEVRANGEFANFDHVRVDGVRVDEMHYDAREGSTIITLKPSFLSTLSDGVLSLTFAYKDGGEANTNFTVAAKPAVYVPGDADATPTQVDATVAADGASGVDVPKTGDSALVILYVCMMVAAIAGLYAVRAARRVRQ